MAENESTSTPAGLATAEPAQPAPAAEDQNAALPAAAEATAETPKEETPEQIEERRREKARQHEQRRLQRRTTEAAEAKAEAKLLREENERLRQAQQQRDKGSDEPKRDAFENLEDYYRAVARWEAKQVSAAEHKTLETARQGREQQSRQASEQAEIARNWQAREAEFQKATKDYAEVVGPFVDGELQDLHQSAKTAIAESEKGPELLYFLAQPENAEEIARIAALSPQRQVMELGALTSKLGTKAAKPSNAPDPIKPLGQGRSGTKDPSKMSDPEYKALRKSQGARWAQ